MSSSMYDVGESGVTGGVFGTGFVVSGTELNPGVLGVFGVFGVLAVVVVDDGVWIVGVEVFFVMIGAVVTEPLKFNDWNDTRQTVRFYLRFAPNTMGNAIYTPLIRCEMNTEGFFFFSFPAYNRETLQMTNLKS